MEVLCLFIPHLPPPREPRPEAARSSPGEDGYARSFEAVLDILDRFSPAVEVSAAAPGKAFLDVTGTEKLFGPAADLAEQVTREVLRETGLRSRAAVAGSKFVAGAAAPLASAGPLVVPGGGEKRFLAPLPVELLPVSPEALSWLRRLGLRRLGQVAGPAGKRPGQPAGRGRPDGPPPGQRDRPGTGDTPAPAGHTGGNAFLRAAPGEPGRPAGCPR